ncbi:MAG: hypothetical protein WBE26_16205 [Phycisphaerae bacterium]
MKRLAGVAMLVAMAYPCFARAPLQPARKSESAVRRTSPGLTREQAQAAIARITDIYRNATELAFVADIAQEGMGAYHIHALHRSDFVWFLVEEHGKPLYEASALRVDALVPAGKSVGMWMVVDKNYSTGGSMSVFPVDEESFPDGWRSQNGANYVPCLTDIVNRPLVGPRSNIVYHVDKLLGTRADLLPSRKYMKPSEYLPVLREQGYIDSSFPTDKILHVWRRQAGPAYMGNEGTDVVTLCMKENEWVVLRRMTMRGEDVTVKDTWKVDPKSGLIVQWDRDFGHDPIQVGRIRTAEFVYLTNEAPQVKLIRRESSNEP